MTNEQIKQAYVIGKAARGVLRYKYLQKQAMLQKRAKETAAPAATGNDTLAAMKALAGEYALPVGASSAAAALLGALIQGARGKSILKGLLVGGGLGGIAGAGGKALYDALPAATSPDATSAAAASPTPTK